MDSRAGKIPLQFFHHGPPFRLRQVHFKADLLLAAADLLGQAQAFLAAGMAVDRESAETEFRFELQEPVDQGFFEGGGGDEGEQEEFVHGDCLNRYADATRKPANITPKLPPHQSLRPESRPEPIPLRQRHGYSDTAPPPCSDRDEPRSAVPGR
jgi:hypothetical protein